MNLTPFPGDQSLFFPRSHFLAGGLNRLAPVRAQMFECSIQRAAAHTSWQTGTHPFWTPELLP